MEALQDLPTKHLMALQFTAFSHLWFYGGRKLSTSYNNPSFITVIHLNLSCKHREYMASQEAQWNDNYVFKRFNLFTLVF